MCLSLRLGKYCEFCIFFRAYLTKCSSALKSSTTFIKTTISDCILHNGTIYCTAVYPSLMQPFLRTNRNTFRSDAFWVLKKNSLLMSNILPFTPPDKKWTHIFLFFKSFNDSTVQYTKSTSGDLTGSSHFTTFY